MSIRFQFANGQREYESSQALKVSTGSNDKRSGALSRSSFGGPCEKRNQLRQTFCSARVCTYDGTATESDSHAAEESWSAPSESRWSRHS